jgi:intein-encoded DNA endonuclease-like protein
VQARPVPVPKVGRDYMSNEIDWTLKEQSRYIRGFSDGEGSVIFGWSHKTKNGKKYKQRNRSIKLSNTNKGLLLKIKKMLENLGIKSHLYIDTRAGTRRSTKDSWSLTILGKENFEKFQRIIGFNEEWKSKRLQQIISSYR